MPADCSKIVGNLLVNAVKFTPANGAIDVAITADETNLMIAVTDNGIGISADFVPYVFDKFRQKDVANLQGGLGLGLAIARALVEAHGGQITAASAGEGCGSAFTVFLPLQTNPTGVAGLLSKQTH
jgi:two-component system CheB/CheR fusion protein